jgi:hypothetical protein
VGAGHGAEGDPLRVMGKRNRSGAGREPHGRRWVVDSNSLIFFNFTTWRWVGLKSWTTGLKFANYNKVFSCFVLCAPGIFTGCLLPPLATVLPHRPPDQPLHPQRHDGEGAQVSLVGYAMRTCFEAQTLVGTR